MAAGSPRGQGGSGASGCSSKSRNILVPVMFFGMLSIAFLMGPLLQLSKKDAKLRASSSQLAGAHACAPRSAQVDSAKPMRVVLDRASYFEAASLFPHNFRRPPSTCTGIQTEADFNIHISDIPAGAAHWTFAISTKAQSEGGHSFHVRALLTTVDLKTVSLPSSFEDHLNGTYKFRLRLPDAGRLSVVVFLRFVLFEGYRGTSGMDLLGEMDPASSQRPVPVKNVSAFPIPIRYNITLFEFSKSVVQLDAPKDTASLPLCRRGDFEGPGRWVDDQWAPTNCRLQDFGDVEKSVCKSGLRLLMLGDSVTRGMYFDILEFLEGKDYDKETRIAAKLSKANSFVSNSVKRFDMHVEYRGWALVNIKSPVTVSEPLEDFDVIIITSGPHDLFFTSFQRWFLLAQAAAKSIQNSEAPSKFAWRSVTSPGQYPPLIGNCSLTNSYISRYTNRDRFRVAKEIASRAFRDQGVNVIDMWDLTASREDDLDGVHFDKTYIQPGLVSKVAANMLLNYVCNEP